ncbi:hypothetical protein CVT26_009572 [Gymnopilus dilepis]|uniref:Uncharacterized protein n=1 Tax=Gymnopilus dilepis TaxID=231916 RepID=A0A409VKB4_9AGAR|nr:hypothetical protein CVT26_009572 [Gymnopilus dilepis]
MYLRRRVAAREGTLADIQSSIVEFHLFISPRGGASMLLLDYFQQSSAQDAFPKDSVRKFYLGSAQLKAARGNRAWHVVIHS